MTASAFRNAVTIVAPSTTPKKDEKERIDLPGLSQFAMADTVLASLERMHKTLGDAVKRKMLAIFIAQGVAKRDRPANFRGVEGNVTASCELRVRSSRSSLSAEQAAVFDRHGIPYETDVSDVVMINPAYAGDEKLARKIETLIARDKSFPKDYLVQQATRVATAASVCAVFQTGDAEAVEALLPLVTTLAVKPAAVSDLDAAINVVAELIRSDVAKPAAA
jgi:hypothetical protein